MTLHCICHYGFGQLRSLHWKFSAQPPKRNKKIRSWKASRLLSSKSHLKEIEMRRYLVTGLLPREADWGSKSDISLGRGCARVDTRHLLMPTASHPGQHPPRRRFPWISWSFGGSCRPVTGSLPSSAPRVSVLCCTVGAGNLSIKHEIYGELGGEAEHGGGSNVGEREHK